MRTKILIEMMLSHKCLLRKILLKHKKTMKIECKVYMEMIGT